MCTESILYSRDTYITVEEHWIDIIGVSIDYNDDKIHFSTFTFLIEVCKKIKIEDK